MNNEGDDMMLIEEFYSILEKEQIRTHFQPIVDLRKGSIIGYEALSRGPEQSIYSSPLELIHMAEKENCLWKLEILFRKKAIQKAAEQCIDSLLFINVDPNVIKDDKFQHGFTREYLAENGLSPDNIVFEITERTAVEDYNSFVNALKHYKNQNYKIAVDDTGAGYSNFATISRSKPQFIKIDMDLIHDIENDLFKQSVIKTFVSFSHSTGTSLIAEGIETSEQLKLLIKLGVPFGQGYLLGKPNSSALNLSEEILTLIQSINAGMNFNKKCSTNLIGHICENVPSFSMNETCTNIRDFLNSSHIEGICLVNEDKPVGLIMKNHLNATLSTQYGYTIFAKKPAYKVLDSDCLIVDYHTPIEKVAELAMTRDKDKIYDNIIVIENFKYYGIVTIINLLDHLIKAEKSSALEANPLTGLPGNMSINRVLSQIITSDVPFCLLYSDLDNFKIYNDVYGFEKGDAIITLTKDILVECVRSLQNVSNFIGHIGGDDFICVLDATYEESMQICENIIKTFDRRIKSYFDSNDRKRGYLIGKDRYNRESRFSLTSISIAGLHGILSKYTSPEEIAKAMSSIKKDAKKLLGSSYIIEKTVPDSFPHKLEICG